MKVLTKELQNDLELHEIRCAVDSREKRTLPIVFLDGRCDGVAACDLQTVKTNFNVSDKENELRFMILPATFTFFDEHYEDSPQKEMRSPENDFLSQYINRLRIISCLPQNILKQVKDKRLLAMGYAEPKVKNDIIEYVSAKRSAALKVLEKSLEDSAHAASGLTIEKQFARQDVPCAGSIAELFDEATITNAAKEANDIYLELDNDVTVILTDVVTLEAETNPESTCIELFELYKNEQNYELHFMLRKQDCNLVENFYYVTYAFKDMRLK